MSEWRIATWTDENYRTIRELAFHESELAEVMALPFPTGAVARDPVMALTNFARHYYWFRRRWNGYKVGDTFTEHINQGDRDCKVLAIDELGNMLYDYEMPAGRIFMRLQIGSRSRPVSEKRLPKKWRDLIA